MKRMRHIRHCFDCRRVSFCLLLLMLATTCVSGGEGGPVSSEKLVGELIDRLDAKHFSIRQAAHQKLVEIGEPARPLLRLATNSGSPEKRQRARAVLRDMLGQGIVFYLPDAVPRSAADEQGSLAEDLALVNGNEFVNRGMKFPESGPLVIPDRSSLDADDHFTIMAWICPDRIIYRLRKGHEGRHDQPVYDWGHGQVSWMGHFIACKWNSVGIHGDFIFAITPSGRLGLGVSNSATGKFVADSLFTENSVLPARWTHVAASFSCGEICLHIDGEFDSSKQSISIHHTNRHEYAKDDLYIGSFWNQTVINNQSVYDFQGQIAELCLFNRRLSTEEIQGVMRMTRENYSVLAPDAD